MQAIYGFKQAERSDFYLAIDQIDELFSGQNIGQDSQKSEGYKQLSKLMFEDNYLKDTVLQGDTPDKAYKAGIDAINLYQNQVRKDKKYFQSLMLLAVDKIQDQYLSILKLLVELGDMAKTISEEKIITGVLTTRSESVLQDNKILMILKEYEPLSLNYIKHNISWDKEKKLVRRFFREVVKPDEAFQNYLKMPTSDIDSDRKLIDHIAKKLIFKHDIFRSYFEEKDINWVENESIIKSMVLKTIKSVDESGVLELSALSKSWDEDKEFFKDLYDLSLENDQQLEEIIVDKIKNWDIERISLTDHILLKMAIAEMIHFPSIPVKVTINEYIELAKQYSTPKSNQFLNGTLDAISQDLISKKLIRKSGRGLMDNK